MIRIRSVPMLSLVLLVGACATKDKVAADTAAMAPAPAAAAGGAMATSDSAGKMAGMGGMKADTVVTRVQGDLSGMDAAAGEAIVPLVAAHKQTVEALIADCEMMMKKMNMAAPQKWTKAVAALHADVGKMTTANAAALHAMWPDHKQRVQGMLDMRHDMMKM